jgi:hypothetical protein
LAAGFTPAATHSTFSSPRHRPEYLLRKSTSPEGVSGANPARKALKLATTVMRR